MALRLDGVEPASPFSEIWVIDRVDQTDNDQKQVPRILVVEDSPVVSLAFEVMLDHMGMEAVGPFGNMADALRAAENAPLDAAVVDLNIRGSKAYSLFHVLSRRSIPFLIASGYADWNMPDQWQDRPRLSKPFSDQQFQAKLNELLNGNSQMKSE